MLCPSHCEKKNAFCKWILNQDPKQEENYITFWFQIFINSTERRIANIFGQRRLTPFQIFKFAFSRQGPLQFSGMHRASVPGSWYTISSIWTGGKPAVLWGWQSTGRDWAGLRSFLPWRYSKVTWRRSWAPCGRWSCFSSGAGLEGLHRSLPAPALLWLRDLSSWQIRTQSTLGSRFYYCFPSIYFQSLWWPFCYSRGLEEINVCSSSWKRYIFLFLKPHWLHIKATSI